MKVLILSNNSLGLYLFRRELLLEFLKQRYRVFVSAPNEQRAVDIANMGCCYLETPIDRRGINPVTDMSLLKKYISFCKNIRPDIVITYTIKPNIYGGFACRMLGVPYAANITGLGTAFQKKGVLRALVSMMYRTALKRAKVVFFENAGNMETLLNEKIVLENQCQLLPGAGVNLEHYSVAPYPKEDQPVRFLFIGRVMAEKGINELFAAMERLHQEGFPCCLDVLGGYEEDYAERIEACTKAGWLHYHGYQQDVRPYIAQSHCSVLPSWHEGMANTNLECASMGRPLITSRIHGCMEAVVEGESGFLCRPKDVDSLYEAMKKFCAMNYEERASMGKAGRRHMEAVFDKREVVKMTLEKLNITF